MAIFGTFNLTTAQTENILRIPIGLFRIQELNLGNFGIAAISEQMGG